jgi:hypothetical protein
MLSVRNKCIEHEYEYRRNAYDSSACSAVGAAVLKQIVPTHIPKRYQRKNEYSLVFERSRYSSRTLYKHLILSMH